MISRRIVTQRPTGAWVGTRAQAAGEQARHLLLPPPAHLQHVLELVDAEPQLGHAGLEELPEAVLLHQPHEHTEGLLLGHLRDRRVESAQGMALCCFCSIYVSWTQTVPGCLDPHNKPLYIVSPLAH